jgi:TetR/AcrR family transcriptional regulator
MGARLPAGERREKIIRAAVDLFARRGFSGVKTRELATASGISEAMLFKHFPRKEALYRAILRRHLEDVERAFPIGGLAASEVPPEEFFGGIARTLLRRMDEDPTLLRLMFFSALEGHPMAREFERARARPLRQAIVAYLRRRARRGGMRPVDPEVAARAFVWTAVGFGISRALFRESGARAFPREVLVRRIVDQFLDGVRSGGVAAGGRP